MPPKTLLFNLGCRNIFICRSCLVSLRQQAPKPWAFRSVSQVASVAQPQGQPSKSSVVTQDTANESAGDDSVTIRYFEQDDHGNIRRLRDNDEFAESMHKDVETQLKELEDKYREASGLMKTIEKIVGKKKAEKLKRKYKCVIEEEEEDRSLPDIPLIPETGTARKRKLVRDLNEAVRIGAKRVRRSAVTPHVVTTTWQRYSLARNILALSSANIPPEVWDCLWKIFSWDEQWNRNRMSHIYYLAKDMTSAGLSLAGSQQLLAMEAMFIESRQNEAIENWKRAVVTLGSKPETFKPFWELGVRMYSLHGDINRAERALDTLLESSEGADPKIIFPFIRTCAKRGVKDKAWERYRRLREVLGSSMQIEDYDEVISSFLSAKEADYAFHVFVDMMFSGAIDIHETTRLPSRVKNSFFMGKWLKRLIGAGDLDGALTVLRFAQAKFIMLASIQVNGLIGAWLRSGTAGNQQKAEELAWAMIDSRRVFVELRRRSSALEWPLRLYTGLEDKKAGELVFVPKADRETYSLMAENYKNRGVHRRLEELWVAFKEAEIAPDAFMMNQLLDSYALQGKAQEARDMYELMVHEHQILPNAHTFYTLVKSLRVNRLVWTSLTDEDKAEDATILRQLFNDMVASRWSFDAESGSYIRDVVSRYVLHTFGKVGDYVGVIVALRALREVFGFELSELVTVEMVAQTGDLHRNTPRTRQRILDATGIIEAIMAERQRASSGKGEIVNNQTTMGKADELAGVIEHYYRNKLDVADEKYQEMYDATVHELGVYDSLATKRPVEHTGSGM